MSFYFKKLAAAMAVVIAALAVGACSGSKDKQQEIVDRQNDELTQALSAGDVENASRVAESMALYVDDLTPEETVMVLTAFLEAHNKADGKDLETMRKYVDVYDIALSVHGDALREAMAGAKRINGDADFQKAAADFRRVLAEYDALKTYGETPVEEAPADSTAAPTDSAQSVVNASERAIN